jgi:hypothetical protein
MQFSNSKIGPAMCSIVAMTIQVAFERKDLLDGLNNEYCSLLVFIYMLVPFKRLQKRAETRREKHTSEMKCIVKGKHERSNELDCSSPQSIRGEKECSRTESGELEKGLVASYRNHRMVTADGDCERKGNSVHSASVPGKSWTRLPLGCCTEVILSTQSHFPTSRFVVIIY